MPNINEYTGDFLSTAEDITKLAPQVAKAEADVDLLSDKITDPAIAVEATKYLGDQAPAAANQFAEQFLAKQDITDPGVALQYAQYLNQYKGAAASIDFMKKFQESHGTGAAGGLLTDNQLYNQQLQNNAENAQKITYGGFEEDKISAKATTPIQDSLQQARAVTGAVMPSLRDNIYENKAALHTTINQSNLAMQDAYRKGDKELVASMVKFVEAATSALNALSYGANNSKMYGDELGVNTPRRGAMEPVRPGDSMVRDLSKVEANIIARDPTRANNLSNFQQFRKLLENDNRYNLTKPQLAYLLATVDYQTGGTFSAASEERLPFGVNTPEDIVAQNLRAAGFHGRGYSGLRGKDAYIGLSQVVGQDLVNNPGKLANPQVSYNVLIEGVMNGLFTGKRLDDYINAQKSDFYNARNVMDISHNGAKDIMVLANRYLEEL